MLTSRLSGTTEAPASYRGGPHHCGEAPTSVPRPTTALRGAQSSLTRLASSAVLTREFLGEEFVLDLVGSRPDSLNRRSA